MLNMEFDPLSIHIVNELNEELTVKRSDTNAAWVHQELAQVKIKVFHGHKDTVKSCSFCGSSERALTASIDKTIKIWNLEDGALLNSYEGHDLYITQAKPDPSGQRFVSSGWDKKIMVWNTETGRVLWTGYHDSVVTCCNFSNDGKLVISGSDLDHTVKIWDVDSGELIHEINDLHSSTLTSCIFSPLDDRIITSSMDKTTRFWDMKSQSNTITLGGHINIVSDISMSRDEHKLATVSWDKSIAFWDIATGSYRSKGPDKLEKAHEGCVSSCDFSTDGQMLVTGGFDQQVCVWDTENNVQKLRLQGHEDWIEDVCFSKDQKWILSASKDKTVRLWNVENTDDIPLVFERKKAIGLKVFNCTICGKQFSVAQADTAEDVKKCVFCRLKHA